MQISANPPVLVVRNKVEDKVAQGAALLLQPLHVFQDGVKVVLWWIGVERHSFHHSPQHALHPTATKGIALNVIPSSNVSQTRQHPATHLDVAEVRPREWADKRTVGRIALHLCMGLQLLHQTRHGQHRAPQRSEVTLGQVQGRVGGRGSIMSGGAKSGSACALLREARSPWVGSKCQEEGEAKSGREEAAV